MFLLSLLLLGVAQGEWYGGDEHEEEQTTGVFYDRGSTEGLHLFPPREGMTTYLIDNKGEEVHRWIEPDGLQVRAYAYLTEDGTLLRGVRTPSDFFNFPPFWGGSIREYDKEGQCIWEFRYSSTLYRQIRDFRVLPNGNVIATATENHHWFDAYIRGYTGDCNSNPDGFWSETLVEVERTGHKNEDFDKFAKFGDGDVYNTCKMISTEKDVIWKWDVFDHSGDLLKYSGWDINKRFSINKFDYLPSRDHIVIACRDCGEIFIIDHGVKYTDVPTKEGQFIYRWGNPSNYGKKGEHRLNPGSAEWVRDNYGWDFKHEEGSVIIYNNDDPEVDGTDSSVVELTPPYKHGKYEKNDDGTFGPDDFNYKIVEILEKLKVKFDDDKHGPNYRYEKDEKIAVEYNWRNFNSRILGFAHKLPSGNVFIANSMTSESLEIEKFDTSIWKYISPYTNVGDPDGINDLDDVLGKFDEIPICDADGTPDPCTFYPIMIKYSKEFKGIKKLFY